MFELCASILAADFANLERDMRAANAAGVDAFIVADLGVLEACK